MFFHGREAYRRNSFLVLYTYFKNVLYVIAFFYLGFFSGFSGQLFYNQWLYQAYNIVMTSIPIVWYAIFDFEYKKELPNEEYFQPSNLN